MMSYYVHPYKSLVGLPGFVWDFYCQLCLYVSLFLSLCISPKPNLKYACLPADLLTHPSLSLSPPPSLFPDKKFPVVEAHFRLDKLFYYIDISFLYTVHSLFVIIRLMLSAACPKVIKLIGFYCTSVHKLTVERFFRAY